MATTNLFTAPGLQGRRLHRQRPRRAPLRAAQGDPQHRPGRRARRHDLRRLGRPRGRRVPTRRRTSAPRSTATGGLRPARRVRRSTRATTSASPSSRSRTSRAATSCCRRVGHALAFIDRWSAPSWSASTPRSATSRWPASTSRTASPRRCGTASSSTSTSTASPASSTTRTSCSAPATCCAPSASSTCWRTAAPAAPAYEGPRHFDFKPPRTEDIEGVWASAAANMRNYLILKAAFRADPEVQEALRASRVDELAQPTLGDGETSTTCSPTAGVRGVRRGCRGGARLGLRAAGPAGHRAPARRPLIGA